jgi:predicted benzoate:H+ symporter BenE
MGNFVYCGRLVFIACEVVRVVACQLLRVFEAIAAFDLAKVVLFFVLQLVRALGRTQRMTLRIQGLEYLVLRHLVLNRRHQGPRLVVPCAELRTSLATKWFRILVNGPLS